MPKSTGHADYSASMALIDENMKKISKHTDPVMWNLSAAVGLLARAFQQDMIELRERFDAVDNKLSKMK